jgi:hypothetical protein
MEMVLFLTTGFRSLPQWVSDSWRRRLYLIHQYLAMTEIAQDRPERVVNDTTVRIRARSICYLARCDLSAVSGWLSRGRRVVGAKWRRTSVHPDLVNQDSRYKESSL